MSSYRCFLLLWLFSFWNSRRSELKFFAYTLLWSNYTSSWRLSKVLFLWLILTFVFGFRLFMVEKLHFLFVVLLAVPVAKLKWFIHSIHFQAPRIFCLFVALVIFPGPIWDFPFPFPFLKESMLNFNWSHSFSYLIIFKKILNRVL